MERYSAAHLAVPIAAARAVGLPRWAYTIRTGADTAYPDEEAVVCLALRRRDPADLRRLDPALIALVEPQIPALVARGFQVVRGLNVAGERGLYELFYFWDGRPGVLIDCQARQRRFVPGGPGPQCRPGVWPWPEE